MSETHRVTFVTPEEAVTVEVAEDEYLLFAAFNAGLDLPSMCLQGWCLSCAAKIVEGEVDQSAARRYYDADRKAGFTLLCSAQPRSDLVIRTHAKAEMAEHRAEHELPAPRG